MAGHDRLVLGVRPEDVEIVPEAEIGHDFRTTVDVVELMGNENQVHLAFDAGAVDGSGEATGTFVATVSGMRRVESGRDAVVRIPEDAIHLFDRETGEALHNRELEPAETAPPNV